ncbi:MAG: FAD-dependent monooxygenase [Pseudomonadota bacterium]|nr:FAD-dependent monooxygenase [Pseudomonadota bacterium]
MDAPLLIAGGGPGGLVAAIALRRKGFDVRVFERAPELRVAGAGLALQINAVRMLVPLGLSDAVAAAGQRLAAGSLELADGTVLQRMDLTAVAARFGQSGVAIHRGALAELLAGALPAGAVEYGAGVVDLRQDADGVTAVLSDGREVQGAALVGADGIHSTVRLALFGEVVPRYAGYTCWRGVAPPSIPVPPNCTTERWGIGRRFGVVPLGAAGTYWFATNNAPAGGTDPADVHGSLRALFAGFADPVPGLIAGTPAATILRNDIVDLPILPRWTIGRVTLLGDAAHAMTPNMGQGACQAIEDAVILADHLAKSRADLPAALTAYEAARRDRVIGIVRQSERFGKVAQWENPVARGLRDLLFRAMPSSLMAGSVDALYGVEVPA